MKATLRKLLVLIMITSAGINIIAQKAVLTTNTGMTIGFGLGGSYQKADVLNSLGAGFDFWLGHNFARSENSFLAADWKFRFVAAENRAHDHRINLDGTFTNVRFAAFNYDLELGLTLNRLRERTGLVLSGFAGAGITHGRTFTDLLDASATPYDFTGIEINKTRPEIYADLLDLSDGEYETRVANKAALMPTLGFFIGYRFSRSFTLGIEHKVNFAINEQTGFFGMNMDNSVVPGSRRDRLNYTTLGFKWSLGGGGGGGRVSGIRYSGITPSNTTTTRQTITPTRPVNDPVPVISIPPPSVEIINPMANPHNTTSPTAEVTARVMNVRSRQGVRVIHNGNNLSFEFNPGNGIVRAQLNLSEGTNNVAVAVANEAGNSSANVVIYYRKPAVANLPVIRFVNPPNPLTVENNVFPLRAQTTHITAWQDVTVTVNGVSTSNFSLSPEGLVTTNIGLREGSNTVEIAGKNSSGATTEKTTITLIRPARISPPQVTITQPGTSPTSTFEPNQVVRASVRWVKMKEGITVNINGVSSSDFIFDAGMETVTFTVQLREGSNNITIRGRNEAGEDSKTLIINKETRPCPLPSVTITAPVATGFITDNQNFTLRAELANVTGRNQITLNINGNLVSTFSYSGSQLSHQLRLVQGTNNISIAVATECGTATATSSVVYKPADIPVIDQPCPKPVVIISLSEVNRTDATHELTGTVTNVSNITGVTMSVDGRNDEGFSYVPNTGALSAKFRFTPGTHTVVITVKNECGTDTKQVSVTVAQPCIPPQVTISLNEVNRTDATHELTGTVTNVSNITGVTMSVDGRNDEGFSYVPNTGALSAKFRFTPGTHTVVVTVKNECGTDTKQLTATVEEPCIPPKVTLTVTPLTGQAATHDLKGTVTGVVNRGSITLNINGKPDNSFVFTPEAMAVTAKLNLQPGTHVISLAAKNECGEDLKQETIKVEEKQCGPRINPGNSSWEFCLVTPTGTITRDSLTNKNFAYSGPASSLFFMPIAGGGDATVAGNPYTIRPGQYYLFTGNLTVSVSSKHPGAMGQWSVCITADKPPVSGNGNNRPKSPCEQGGGTPQQPERGNQVKK